MAEWLDEIENAALRMQLVLDICRVLKSNACQRIDFHYMSIHVNGAGFAAVAGALMDNAQGKKGVAAAFGDLPTQAAASYVSGTNTLTVPPGFRVQTVLDKHMIVHECVHAMQDILEGSRPMRMVVAPRTTLRVDNEGAAWVAAALYLLYESGMPDPSSKAPFVAAQDIAMRIKDWPGVGVAARDVARMRATLRAIPAYRHLRGRARTIADGL